MRALREVVCTALLVAVGTVAAQPGPGPGRGPGAGPMASAPGMGPGPGRMGRWGSDYTPGWSMMTPQERADHQQRMRSMKSYDECKAYRDEHHQQMVARAKERGGNAPAQPRRDACAGMKP